MFIIVECILRVGALVERESKEREGRREEEIEEGGRKGGEEKRGRFVQGSECMYMFQEY